MLYILIFIGIVIIALVFIGQYRFDSMVNSEKEAMLKNTPIRIDSKITLNDLEHLPEPLQSYVIDVGLIGKNRASHVIFKQHGRIKTTQDKNWMPFKATQYMTTDRPNFIWKAKAFPIHIRDKCIEGVGEVKVNLLGLKNIAVSNGPKIDKSALGRALGELMFFPFGFLSPVIQWEALNDTKVKATITINNISTEGIFCFSESGQLQRFEAKRYRGDILDKFTGIGEDYQLMAGLTIPTKMRAIWNLADGDFEYFDAKIVDYTLELI